MVNLNEYITVVLHKVKVAPRAAKPL